MEIIALPTIGNAGAIFLRSGRSPSVAPPGGQDRIMIYGPKSDGTYIIEFRMADGESLAISVPAVSTSWRCTKTSGPPGEVLQHRSRVWLHPA
jgi:hypothetical protein